MQGKTVYHFDNVTSSGINEVPNNSKVVINDNSTIIEVLKVANTGLAGASTVQEFLNNSNLYLSNRVGTNILINGEVTRINQRAFDGDWVEGEYGYDRWLGTSTAMTQIVEEGNYKPDTVYTLSGVSVTTQQLTSPTSGHWTIPEVDRTARNIQLEVGSVATPFEIRGIGAEFLLCERYYQKVIIPSNTGYFMGSDNGSSLYGFSYDFSRMLGTPVASFLASPTYTNCTGQGLQIEKISVAERVSTTDTSRYRISGGIIGLTAEL